MHTDIGTPQKGMVSQVVSTAWEAAGKGSVSLKGFLTNLASYTWCKVLRIEKSARLSSIADFLSLAFFDLSCVIIMLLFSVHVRQLLTSVFPDLIPPFNIIGIHGISWRLLVWFFFFFYEGLYTKRFTLWEEIAAIWKAAFFSTVGIFTIASIGGLTNVSRVVIILTGVLVAIVLPLFRMLSKRLMMTMGLLKRRVLILGAGETGRLIAKALRREWNYGYEVIGFLDDDPKKVGQLIEGVKVHKGLERADSYIQRCRITDLVLALPSANRKKLQWLANDLQHKVDRILFVPDIFGIAVIGTNLRHFSYDEAFALELKNNLHMPLNIFIKRVFDIIVSILLLPFILLPMALIALMIRFDSAGPALFHQRRLARNGRTFRCLKFRTMHDNAEDRLEELLQKDPEALKEYNTYWKLKDDPRVTRMGKFLRATSLDELPQIFNVLKGEMSLVGPRPYLPSEEDAMGDYRNTIVRTKPGITGLWQVSGRSNTSYRHRLGLDNWYVKNWNLWLDIEILLKTVNVVIKKEGAH